MEPLVKFRLFAVRISMAITLVLAISVYPLAGRPASIGLLLGGLAGTLVFWVTAQKMEKLATKNSNAVYSVPLTWRVTGMVVYALVLVRAYTLDREGLSGLVAAAVGLFLIRIAMVALGLTGLDLPKEEE